MRKSGQITVFLSLALLCIFSLMCGLIESARTAGARYYLKLAADSAMDSVFSGYHKAVWDKYRILLLECENENQIEESWKTFMEPYMENSGWYSMDMENAKMVQLFRITDDNGKYINQEIQDYMRYGIFENITDEDGAEVLLQNIKEAKAVERISEAYGGHTREAVLLERALEDINDCLRQQKNHWKEADDSIRTYDGSGFRRKALALEGEMNRIPSLVKAYKKRADNLKKSIEKTNEELNEVQKELSQDVRGGLYADTSCYGTYIDQEGVRRKEIEALPEEIKELKPVIEQAKEHSEEVEEIISNWDDDEEGDDGPDESELWGSVGEIWSQVNVPFLSYSSGIKDPEKQKILEQVQNFVQGGLLSLVIPEGKEISKGLLTGFDLPSSLYETDAAEAGKLSAAGLVDQLLFDEYCGKFLTCFTSEEEKETKYELEYLIAGKNTDEENLKQAVSEVLMIRAGMSFIHILSDSRKRQEAANLAGAITGVIGFAPLTAVTAFFIMNIWALGEAAVDVRMLLEGKKTAFVKSEENWNLSLEGLLELGRSGTFADGKEDENGLSYAGYLKLLLFAGQAKHEYYRLMDIIQINICRKQKGFRMAQCVYQTELKGTVSSKRMFFGGSSPFYSFEVKAEKAY